MWIISASDLSAADMALLGNNIRPPRPRRRRCDPGQRVNRRMISAVNRSLARLGERVERLYPPLRAS